MKRTAILLLLCCALLSIIACGNNGEISASVFPSDNIGPAVVSSENYSVQNGEASDEMAQWDEFVTAMEKQGVSYDEIHSIESSGLSRQEIMRMTAEEIKNHLTQIAEIIRQNKENLAREMLADWKAVKNDPQFVFTDYYGTTGIDLVQQCIASIKANDWGSVTGYMFGSTIAFVYDIVYEPDGAITLTRYAAMPELVVERRVVTDIYETAMFFQFTDQKEFYFSIPKVSFANVEEIKDYQADGDIKNAPISAIKAKEAVITLSGLFSAYLGYTYENNLGNPINSYGVIIPADFSSQVTATHSQTAVADGAAIINGTPYYKVAFYQDGSFGGDMYYIDSENARNVFCVSMVDGNLIPIAYKDVEHFSVG